MTVIGKTSHALFFNGVSDSIICPLSEFNDSGIKIPIGTGTARSSRSLVGPRDEEGGIRTTGLSRLKSFAVEAWVRPDSGGVVASKDGLFRLTIGQPGRSAPASFTVQTVASDGKKTSHSATTGSPSSSGFTGITYPNSPTSLVSNTSETSKGTRELIHIAGVFNTDRIFLIINGEIVASAKTGKNSAVDVNGSDFLIGGEGGQFRGYIEGVHWRREAEENNIFPLPLVKDTSTIGLWRFEEPVEVDNNEFYLKSNVSTNDTILTLDTAQVQTMYQAISGKSDTFTGTYTVPSMGDYRVGVTTHSDGAQVVSIPHTIANLLINPTCTDVKTGKPNNKPPERVRLKSINAAGTVVVESIHLDFDFSPNTGARGILFSRTAFNSTNNLSNDSTIVLLKSDLLLDEGTGQPLQPPGLGSQAIDKNGMTIIDESDYRHHGYLFSRRLSINETTNGYTISNANWTIEQNKFQSGHSGRHLYSHVSGHPYLRILPQTTHENVIQTIDGMSDIMQMGFDGMASGVINQVPPNSKIGLYKRGHDGLATQCITYSKATQVISNGLETLDPDRHEIIAIGGSGFNINPFLLKGHGIDGVVATDDIYDIHLSPETESRVAILETGNSNFPCVEIHYNAVDLTGDTIGTNGPALLVTKTVPSGGSVIGGNRVAATIASAISSGKTMRAPGGIIRLTKGAFGDVSELLKSHNLVGDNTGGTQYEVELDLSYIPTNYSPRISTDDPQSPPLGIDASHADDPTHPSVYHHIVVRPNTTVRSSSSLITDQQYKLSPTTGNSGGVNQSTNLFEMFDIIDNGMDNNGYFLIAQPTDRKRTMQLEKFSVSAADPSLFSIEFLVSSGRVTSIKEKQSEGLMEVTIVGRGMMDDIASMQSDYEGRGSPNSVIVKETKPDAPVVTVTLGGPGQGAVETTPTWDKSPLTRLGWNSRRDGGARVTASTSTSLTVAPLNNNSDALASWGTYMFPVRGRIHLENGASAEYYDTTATAFTVTPGDQSGTGRFINSDGSEQDTFTNWLTTNSVVIGQTNVLLDPLFDEASVVSDGTTINDRLFQSIGSVAHDYQLGTQYASTRALVEIPVFSNQFFDDPRNGVFPGPDNSMKIHLDPTLTAHSWAPNPVGRRSKARAPADRDVLGPYHKRWVEDTTRGAVIITAIDKDTNKVYVKDLSQAFPNFEETISTFRNITGIQKTYDASVLVNYTKMHRRIYTPDGEWAFIGSVDGESMIVSSHSQNFWEGLSEGSIISMIPYLTFTGEPIRGDPTLDSAENEFRRPYYYDRANVQTQGGNIDYGLRQYVSAVEFKEGPSANPHAKKIESGCATFEIISQDGSSGNWFYIGDNIPSLTGSEWDDVSIEAINQDDEILLFTHHADGDKIDVASGTPAAGDIYTVKRLKLSDGTYTHYYDIYDDYIGELNADQVISWQNILNKTWSNPYAPGGLRHGDTVWMNMHYTNPHAIEGLFCKSRGVLNEFMVWNGFNGGEGELASQARDSIPLENFLIGNSCMETAQNFVQHVNKTVELNWLELGYSASEVPVVAYLDPYLAKEGHARVLLYDVAHDREFIAFHDIHMQVQTGQTTPKVNGLDVANGFYSQNRLSNRTATKDQSDFIEGAYCHRSSPYMEVTATTDTHNANGMNDAYISYGASFLGSTGRTDNSTVVTDDVSFVNNYARVRHRLETTGAYISTFFDTPDGTRAIPAFLCLKGNRANSLDLTGHSESRLQHLPQWTQMDFVRRLTLDLGEIGQSDRVSDIESAVYEMVRRVNQAAALQGRSVGGSTHDPAPFWDDTAFGGDKGSHMGYLRAHFGRAVKDLDGNDGYTIVIHSTVPGASGRNFCAWLDNSKAQSVYRPQFLVGHGGRFRSFWAMPMEGEDENMHPAPMPITKNGRPFAPITTLRQMVPSDDEDEEFINNLADYDGTNTRRNSEMATGRGANTLYGESFESQGDANRMVEGLRTGTRARARINFGGLVASGVPGWAPDAGSMGFGILNKGGRFDSIYNDDSTTSYSTYVTEGEQSKDDVGKGELYGFRFTDHRGTDHTIRLVYREKGQSFANNNTILPPSLENEIIISFDDSDVSKGGFTIGKNMKGSTYPVSLDPGSTTMTGNIIPSVTWRGNTWNGIKAPANGYAVNTATVSGNSLTIRVHDSYHLHSASATSQDYLGHLGFPDEGLFVWTDNNGDDNSTRATNVFRYTSRTHNAQVSSNDNSYDTNSTHTFYGVSGGTPIVSDLASGNNFATISPMLNWTTIVTDELIAAAVEHAMSVDPNKSSKFNCSGMYAPDGRTYKEWMGAGASTAIQVHTLNDKKKVTPLKDLFSVSRDIDLGLYAGNAETYLTSAQIEEGVVVDTGYLPRTLLNITANFRGENANTATPVLIKSDGSAVSTSEWQKHLRGERFTAYAGDHITPCLNNPIVKITSGDSTSFVPTSPYFDILITPWQLWTSYEPLITIQNWFLEPFTVYDKGGNWATVKQLSHGSPYTGGRFNVIAKHDSFGSADMSDTYLSLWTGERGRLFAGNRVAGNTYGEPLTYFRGAHDSPDHSVPLYFGGGFSGVVMDINDGTQNDYTEFYSHPYSSGPTGCAGLQNVGENMGAHAILDTSAMLAMFPGTPFLNQHRGESQPPFTNADALLAPDMNVQSSSLDAGKTAQMMGFADDDAKEDVYQDNGDSENNQTVVTHPTPIVLRFAHPYARYTAATTGCADEVAYVVFGPGQSVPKHFYGYSNSGQKEPTASKVVSAKYTHVYGDSGLRQSATEPGKYHPNEMSKGWSDTDPNPDVYMDRTGDYRPYLPAPMSWQLSAANPYGALRNWEPAYGAPSIWVNGSFTSASASLISNHWASSNNTASLKIGHPMFGAGGVSSDSFHYNWHMDGGYPAGGNWMDNAVAKNPTHPTTGNRLPDSQTATFNSVSVTLGLNASMFRVGALALEAYDLNLTENTTGDGTTRDVFVVDATRVQNSEELATIISAAINSYPGEGNLKAMGGTFLPSFQEAIRQDRYSWVNVGAAKASGAYSNGTTLTMNGKLPTYIPDKGWIRVVDTTTDNAVFYGRYTAHTPDALNYGVFTLGTNWRSGGARLESPTVALGATASNHDTSAIDANYIVYVWSKTGNLRWSNGAPEALHSSASGSNPDSHIFHHLAATQVHFNGFVDAIDRTRPVGAVGWHGERYSYLNSLKVDNGVSAGLGAWHPLLGFNPYGSAMGVHALNGATAAYTQTGATASFTQDSTGLNSGLHPRHYVVVSNEAELPIIAKADRDGLLLCGDMLDKRWAASNKTGGTVIASHSARHNNDRFAAYAHGGPHVDAQYAEDFAPPASNSSNEWASNPPTAGEMYPMESCLFPTGDLFFDRIENPGVAHYPQEDPINHNDIGSSTLAAQSAVLANPYAFWKGKSAARNFFINHVVWKRMDGGNLCLPAPNARGLGAVPWVWRKVGSSYVKFGETIYGNTRFSFESTNAAVFPTVQAQELAHPQLAEKYPVEIGAALSIPNEEVQFEAIIVIDDSGQEHKIEGGSPLGTVIRDFSRVGDRDTQGPALAGSGDKPNLSINLPDPNTIPGNILVRSGFDKVQAYQHETMGAGGLQRPDLPDAVVNTNFDSTNENPSTNPFWENEGWERVDNAETSEVGTGFPYSKTGSMDNKAPLQTSYEPHDRALYFHLTKMGWGYTEREPLGIVSTTTNGVTTSTMTHNPLTFISVSGSVLTASGAIESTLWLREQTPDGRGFLTVNGHVVSFTGVSGSTFTGCKFTPGFSATSGNVMKPSFYVPAGSTRHFAARRLRDHTEVSGESPDKAPIDWVGVGVSESPAQAIRDDRLTPMPVPRMGHHYVTPTMAVMPGHLSHPLYQRVYNLNRAYQGATTSIEQKQKYDSIVYSTTSANDDYLLDQEGVGVNASMWFSSPSSPHPPSDIHGGAFTLMVETKVRYDGYGILAFDDENKSGNHRLKLEHGTNYSTHWNFPDPLETGAYQIIIQPNLFAQQLMGFNMQYDEAEPGGSGATVYSRITDQQTATVIALQWNGTTYDFILAEALKADVRGCEVYLNEVILDIDPSPNQQFTSLPTLGLYNPLGVNESTSPAWSRKSLPYYPGMFQLASPGYTLTIPWWSPAYTSASGTLTSGVFAGASSGAAGDSLNWRNVEHYHPDQYYHFCRTGYGSVGAQSVMTGYPTHYLNPYLHSYESLNPTCKVKYTQTSGNSLSISDGQILVDNNNLFPEVSKRYNDCRLSVGGYEASYEYRGQASGEENATTNRFYGVNGSQKFWDACTENAIITLTGTTRKPGKVYTDKLSSVAAHHIQGLRTGTGDTGTGHLPDAYLSMWHYNLGRPMTYYSDSRGSMAAAAVDKKPYNHLPEHYETIHYHDFGYVISDGPFDFRGYGWDLAGDNIEDADDMGDGTDWMPQARTANSLKYHYGAFWPGGSRFGAQASRMDLWGTAGPGWGRFWDSDHIIQGQNATEFSYYGASTRTDNIKAAEYDTASATLVAGAATVTVSSTAGLVVGLEILPASGSGGWGTLPKIVSIDSATQFTVGVNHALSGAVTFDYGHRTKRNAAFGHRFCVRGAFNRPRAALWSAQGFNDKYDNEHAGYRFGPYVQNDAVTANIYTPATNANTSTPGTESIASGYSGIIERITNASALVGSDLKGQQVKYSHGRRMCRPFGCAVRNIVNDPYAIRHHQGDYVAGVASADTNITNRRRDLATALAHYMTDWWGNTTGEDVRRLPVRGFGIRPAWDPEDAYRATDRTKSAQVFAAPAEHGKARATLDFFDPATAKRVGDRGDGRGVRWPTVFNEDILQDVDTIMDATGLVLSSNTAEPSFGNGYIRARNDDIQFNESLIGISRRLDTHAEDGLLRPEAMAGSNVESAKNDLLPAGEVLQEPISRIAPRMGLDIPTVSEMSGDFPARHVAIATEAHSLHTDRVAGRRYVVAAGLKTDTKAVSDFDLTLLNFSNFKQVMRLNYTHGIWPMGGTLILDLENYMEPISDLGWGASSGRGSNPYQSGDHNSLSYRTNPTDKLIRFLLRPVRVLDHRHVEVFRDQDNALSGTAGGKYGLFTYSTPSARATTSSRFLRSSNPAVDNPPYAPAYFFATSNYVAPSSTGPNIPGSEASGFTNSLKQTVARISISDNTLQHLRADANRRGDFTVQPRYTQSLYPGTNLNKSDHSGESSHTDNEVDG